MGIEVHLLGMRTSRLELRVENLEAKIEELIVLLKQKQVIGEGDIQLIEPEPPSSYIGPL